MLPWLLLLPAVWFLAYRQGRRSPGAHMAGAIHGPAPHPAFHVPRRPHPFLGPHAGARWEGGRGPRPWQRAAAEARLARGATAAHYLQHLNEAAAAALAVDAVKPAALAADIGALMASPPGVAEAVAALTAPIPVLFAQKDLNVLGASPPVPENGSMGPETRRAIAELQERFGQPPSGRIDAETAAAIRYATGVIYSQDRAFVA